MRSSVKNINLTSVDDLFSTEESRLDEQKEKVSEIPLSKLHPFYNHPFKVIDNDAMIDTAESIKEYGVLVPAIARPRESGDYELISGHRRHRASEIAGLETMPVIIRDLNDNEAIIIMVDSNLQRESILPSEKAFAYKLKLEAIKMQGKRNDITSCQVGTKLRSDHFIAENSTESARQIQRFIRLTELIPQLMNMVDEKKIAFNPAVELSYLKADEQLELIDVMECEQATPSLSQAIRLKKFSLDDKCTYEAMCAIMSEEKKSDIDRITFKSNTLQKYFPKSYTPQKMEETIIKLLDGWHKKRTQQNER